MKTHHSLPDGTVWPTPMDNDDGGLEWRLRYGTPEQLVQDRFSAASVVSAYRELIGLPVKRRQQVIMHLRHAMGKP